MHTHSQTFLTLEFVVCMCLVAQSCLTLCDPMDFSQSGSSVHGIFQARILDLVAISYSRDRTQVSCIPGTGRRILYHYDV